MEHREILVPIDFTERSERAFEEAVKIAEREHATLVLLSVKAPIVQCVEGYCIDEADVRAMREHDRESAEKKFHDLIDRVAAGRDVRIVTRVREGPAYRTILDEQRDRHADLIVMADETRRRFPEYLFSSIPAKIAKHADCSVLLVK